MNTIYSMLGRRLVILPAVTCVAVCSGCATPALWKHTAARQWEPTEVLELRADDRPAHHDVVAIYRERCLSTNAPAKPRLRAYALYASMTNGAAGKGPVFVSFRTATNLCPVPLFPAGQAPTNALEVPALYGVRGEGPCKFTLYTRDQSPQTYELEAYTQKTRTLARVLLTPISVATDAAAVAAVSVVLIAASPGAWGSSSSLDFH